MAEVLADGYMQHFIGKLHVMVLLLCVMLLLLGDRALDAPCGPNDDDNSDHQNAAVTTSGKNDESVAGPHKGQDKQQTLGTQRLDGHHVSLVSHPNHSQTHQNTEWYHYGHPFVQGCCGVRNHEEGSPPAKSEAAATLVEKNCSMYIRTYISRVTWALYRSKQSPRRPPKKASCSQSASWSLSTPQHAPPEAASHHSWRGTSLETGPLTDKG